MDFEIGRQFKQTLNGVIVQDLDEVEFEKFEVVSRRKPTEKRTQRFRNLHLKLLNMLLQME